MTGDPSFAIPARPRRRYPSSGGVEYEGQTRFRLEPATEMSQTALGQLVESVLADGPYRSGAFIELPMPLWLVRDEGSADVFRVSIRGGCVRLHVLPETGSAGLRRFYDRLVAAGDCAWAVDCRSDIADGPGYEGG
ncbi:hypothetical protein [Halomicrobium katesii]|uniref:hypothetical protein n=1 Tax=Halomicrobium katesii TaxID=437163 RepID=UPI000364729D|nr:hypothetical protein [Halomicrobium katesii]